MPEKVKEAEMLKLDTRLIDYNLKTRQLTLAEYESYLKSLPEEAEFDWTPVFEEPVTPAVEEAKSK